MPTGSQNFESEMDDAYIENKDIIIMEDFNVDLLVERQWFRSYLTGRIQSVPVDGHLSDPLPVSIGSILGPLLFLLFSNDLPIIYH